MANAYETNQEVLQALQDISLREAGRHVDSALQAGENRMFVVLSMTFVTCLEARDSEKREQLQSKGVRRMVFQPRPIGPVGDLTQIGQGIVVARI